MNQKQIGTLYMRELFGALGVYAVLLVIASSVGKPMEQGLLRTLLLVSPMIGFGLMLWAIARHVGRVDEYIRKLLLESVSLAAGITAGLTFTYGFLETAGFPRLSMFAVWGVMCGATMLVCAARAIARGVDRQ